MNERAFGLPQKLFYTKNELDTHYDAFVKVQEDIKYQRKNYTKLAQEYKAKREIQARRQEALGVAPAQKDRKPKSYGYKKDFPSVSEASIIFSQMQAKKNEVPNRLEGLRER